MASVTKLRFVGLDGLASCLIPEVRVKLGISSNEYLNLRPSAIVPQNSSRLGHIEGLADRERLAIVQGLES
jgi:hypothetical protein